MYFHICCNIKKYFFKFNISTFCSKTTFRGFRPERPYLSGGPRCAGGGLLLDEGHLDQQLPWTLLHHALHGHALGRLPQLPAAYEQRQRSETRDRGNSRGQNRSIPLGRPRPRPDGFTTLGALGGRFSRREGLPRPVTVKSKSLGSVVVSPTFWK